VTLYALRPDPKFGSLDEAEVVSQCKYGWGFLTQAVTLWRLVDETRAARIDAVMDRAALAAGDGEVRFYADDLRELVSLLAGIEEAIVEAGIVDKNWRVPPERLEELAKRVPAMALHTERTLANKTSALGEIMINAGSIRIFLSDALGAGCVVVLG
jgi:ATP phosphoribosyltransferase